MAAAWRAASRAAACALRCASMRAARRALFSRHARADRLDQRRQRRLAVAGDRQVHRRIALEVLVVGLHVEIVDVDCDRLRAAREARPAGLAHPVDLVDLAPEVGHLETENHVGLRDQRAACAFW